MGEKIIGKPWIVFEELFNALRRTIVNTDMLLTAALLANQLAMHATGAAYFAPLPIHRLLGSAHQHAFLLSGAFSA
jgi:hypothetical protein